MICSLPFGSCGSTFSPIGFPKAKITILIPCHSSRRRVHSLDCRVLESSRILCVFGEGNVLLGVCRASGLSRHVFVCDCGSQCGKDSLGPLKFSQEGKSGAWHSSGEVIKGSTGSKVRTASKETFKKFGLGGDRSVCSEYGFEGGFFPI